MRAPKFSTIVNTTGCEMLVKGKSRAICDALFRALYRLKRVSGLSQRSVVYTIETLPRTGDNIRMRVTWQQYARA